MRVGIGHDTHRLQDSISRIPSTGADERAASEPPSSGQTPSPISSDGSHAVESFPQKPLILGGVVIPYEKSLLGHSDADVLLHAVTDALLGAAGLGDIGDLFPDTAEKNRGRDSAEFVKVALQLVREKGWRVVNLDSILFAQAPKLSPYKAAIRGRIADLLEISPDAVNVKAKTGEGIGIIGRGEAISAEAIVLLEKETVSERNGSPRQS